MRRPSKRLLVAVFTAALAGADAFYFASTQPKYRDFDQIWHSAGALLDGRDPYAEVGPGRPFDWETPLYYPLPAVLVAVPVSELPRPAADALFMALGVGLLAWALGRHGMAPTLGLAAASVPYAVETVQWSPILAASFALPWVGVLLAAKPTIGVALFLARPSRWAVAGGLALLALSFLIFPGWLSAWRDALASTSVTGEGGGTPYLAPILAPGGVLALAALARWRRPEARLLVAMACVPQTPLLYETVALLFIPRTMRESTALVAGSWICAIGLQTLAPFPSRIAWYTASSTAIVLCCYLPCLVMVLRRPNEGAIPQWANRYLTRAPGWLAGREGGSTS